MIFKFSTFLFFAVSVAVQGFSQVADSVDYPEVRIIEKYSNKIIGPSDQELDSAVIERSGATDLAELLESETSVLVRSYGPGGVASISLRGTSPQHTQLLWNGIPINDPMLGQSDLGTVGLAGIGAVLVKKGPASMSDHPGGFGGSVELLNNKITVPFGASASAFFGSFGQWGVNADASYGIKKVWGSTLFSRSFSENNYSFINTARFSEPLDTLKHAANSQLSFGQRVGFRVSERDAISLHFKYGLNDRELPASMISGSTKEELKDEDIWLAGVWDGRRSHYSVSVTASFIQGRQDYMDNNDYTFAHLYRSSKNLFRIKWYAHKKVTVKAGLDAHFEFASSDSAYQGNANQRYWQGIFASVDYKPWSALNLQVQVREDLIDLKASPFQGSVGFNYSKKQWLSLSGNVSRNFRPPTLNDLFWQPGGNPDLENETGFSYEGGVRSKLTANKFDVMLAATYFESWINNWIVWIPEGSVWSPQNRKQVHVRGVETQLDFKHIFGKWKLAYGGAYNWVRTVNEKVTEGAEASLGKQLIYIPEHAFNARLGLENEKVSIYYVHNFTGLRFTTSDNSEKLNAYQTGDISVAFNFKMFEHSLRLGAKVKNIWNEDYQSIAWYAMPGRSFLFSIKYMYR